MISVPAMRKPLPARNARARLPSESGRQIAFQTPGISVGNEVKAAYVYDPGRFVIVRVRVGRQIPFELNPEETFYASVFIGINEEVLFRVGYVVQHEALAANVLESLIKLELHG